MAFAVVFLGFVIGLVSGATGIGGGTLLAPFMMFVLRVDPFISVGTDIFVSVITKGVSAVIHKRANNIDNVLLRPLAIAGVIGAVVGIIVLALLKYSHGAHPAQMELRRIIGIMLLLCAVSIVFARKSASKGHGEGNVPVSIAGFLIAMVTSVTSVGVGSLSVPVLFFLKGRARMQTVIGTSLAYATVVTAIAAVGQIVLRDVNYVLALELLGGSIPGAIIGSTLMTRASAALRPAVVVLLVISGARLVA